MKRSVLVFASRSQAGPGNDQYPCAFLGQHRTDSTGTLGPIHLQESMVTTPGHYNVLALLPEDNTCGLDNCSQLLKQSDYISDGMLCWDHAMRAGTSGQHELVRLSAMDCRFARGSLFILEPGTKCVMFDLDGTITVRQLIKLILHMQTGLETANRVLIATYSITRRRIVAWIAAFYTCVTRGPSG